MLSNLEGYSNFWVNHINQHKNADSTIEIIPSTSFLVPPTWNKSEHHIQIARVWEKAAKKLGEAEHIYILEYSFPESDAFFRYLYSLGTLAADNIRHVEVYNPDKSYEPI